MSTHCMCTQVVHGVMSAQTCVGTRHVFTAVHNVQSRVCHRVEQLQICTAVLYILCIYVHICNKRGRAALR
jgi:hypothetical protein